MTRHNIDAKLTLDTDEFRAAVADASLALGELDDALSRLGNAKADPVVAVADVEEAAYLPDSEWRDAILAIEKHARVREEKGHDAAAEKYRSVANDLRDQTGVFQD